MSDRKTTCCFTGHRPSKLPWKYDETDPRCVALKRKIFDIAEAVYLSGVRHFICGMAMGCDLYFCEEVLKLRERYEDITVEAAIPCETQAEKWNERLRDRYFSLVEQCDKETLVSRAYSPMCMTKRNQYMVDHSSVIIAVYDGTMGGTMQTLLMAKRAGLEVIQIAP